MWQFIVRIVGIPGAQEMFVHGFENDKEGATEKAKVHFAAASPSSSMFSFRILKVEWVEEMPEGEPFFSAWMQADED